MAERIAEVGDLWAHLPRPATAGPRPSARSMRGASLQRPSARLQELLRER
jgi:hypothetical protein